MRALTFEGIEWSYSVLRALVPRVSQRAAQMRVLRSAPNFGFEGSTEFHEGRRFQVTPAPLIRRYQRRFNGYDGVYISIKSSSGWEPVRAPCPLLRTDFELFLHLNLQILLIVQCTNTIYSII